MQRIAIAKTLANHPVVRLLDEATRAIDPQTTRGILKLLRRLNTELNLTIVMITHAMDVVKEICSHVAVMENGRVVETGEVLSVFASPHHPVTKDFIATTSNLSKVYEMLESDDPVVHLPKGAVLVRLQYLQKETSEPLISKISREFGVNVNILFSDIELVQQSPIGGIVAIVEGSPDSLTDAVTYLCQKNIAVEVIADARISECVAS